MQLELGKKYLTRDNQIFHVVEYLPKALQCFRAVKYIETTTEIEHIVYYNADGAYLVDGLNENCDMDLIKPLPSQGGFISKEDSEKAELAAPSKTTDDGTRRTFSTGYQRDTGKDKGRWELLSQAYYGLLRVAQLFARGAEKYGAANWIKGAPLSVYADCILRHATKAAAGWEDEDHWSAVAWNALCLMQTQEMIKQGLLPKELDDLPRYAVLKETK